MESFRGSSSQQAQQVRAEFGRRVEEVLESFQVPAPPVSHAIVEPNAAVKGWDELDSAAVHFYTDGSFTQQSYDACCCVSATEFSNHLSNNVAELQAILLALQWLQRHRHVVRVSVAHYDTEYGRHFSTGQWQALKNIQWVDRIKDVLKEIANDVKVQRRWIRGHSMHPGNEQADKLAAQGADGLTKHLHVFSGTTSGPRRQRLATAKVQEAPSTSVRQEAQMPEPAVSWDALSQLMVNVALSLVGTKRSSSLWTPYTADDSDDRHLLDQMQRVIAESADALSAAATGEERIQLAKLHRAAKRTSSLCSESVVDDGCKML